MGVHPDAVIRPQGILKIVELLLGLTILCLYRFGVYNTPIPLDDVDKIHVAIVAYAGFFMINIALFLCHIIDDEPYHCSIECILNPIAACLYLAAGASFIDFYSSSHPNLNPARLFGYYNTAEMRFQDIASRGVALGSLSIIQSVIYIVDTMWAFRCRMSVAEEN